ncbi:hypothetical protein [Rhizobium yanglingense]
MQLSGHMTPSFSAGKALPSFSYAGRGRLPEALAALRDHVSGSFVDFRITPKGTQAQRTLPAVVLLPYVLPGGYFPCRDDAGTCRKALPAAFISSPASTP